MTRRHVIIDIPAPSFPPIRKRATGKLKTIKPWLNSNDRLHRLQEAKITKAWREAAARAAHGNQPLNPPVQIIAHIYKERGGRYDPGNLYPTAKACVDGLVDAGLLTDDDHTRVIGPDMRHGGTGNPELVIEIFELTKEQP
ncbi:MULTISPECIES: hypothetical protein [Arthrobacter]|uniref:Uncharacterized protein n=1 Tax=Arthrobacter terricola TaxID=2547396 RepID=A0A4R5K7B2_9MICC|nr:MULTISPECIES: hypothetical protein [Arthrobacter]MBT8163060.1 hypothetical protein [Arthrobacter sp. GN70]TDF88100.1 hypothetical protein E1809_24075 [Arthrobacter terricola]